MSRYRWPLSLLLLLGPAHVAPAQTELAWKFKKGDVFYLDGTATGKQAIKVADSVVHNELTLATVSRVKVLDVPAGGGAVLEQTLESVKATFRGSGAKGEASLLEKLKGLSLVVTLDARGRVTKLEGYEGWVKTLAGGAEELEKTLRGLISADSFKAPLERVFAFSPGKPVSKGASWQLKRDEPWGQLGTLRLTDTFRVEDVEKKGKGPVVVKFTTEIGWVRPARDPAPPTPPVSGGDVRAKEASGTVVFDPAAGRPVRVEWRRKIAARLTFEAAAQGQTLEFDTDESGTVRVLDKKPLQK